MRLTDLDPNFWTAEAGRAGQGITFLCPCCLTQHLGVWFANPVDGGPPAPPELSPAPRWQRSGDTLETLTLSPSIDASASGHWHGFIVDGEIR